MRPPSYDRRSTRHPAYDYARAGAYFVTIVVEGRRPVFGRARGGVMVENAAGRMVRAWWEAVGAWFPGVVVDAAFVVMPDHVHGIVWLPGRRTPPRVESPVGAPLVGAHRATPPAPATTHPTRPNVRPHAPARDEFPWPAPPDAAAPGDPRDHAPHDHANDDVRRATTRVAARVEHSCDVARWAPTRGAGAPTGAFARGDDPCPAHPARGDDACAPHPTRGNDACATPPTLGVVVAAFKSVTTRDYAAGVRDAAWPAFDRRLWQRNYHDRIVRDRRALAAIRAYIHDNPRQWRPPRA